LFTNYEKDSDEPVPNDPAADVAIGDTYQGGIIFYILKDNDNGYVAGECIPSAKSELIRVKL